MLLFNGQHSEEGQEGYSVEAYKSLLQVAVPWILPAELVGLLRPRVPLPILDGPEPALAEEAAPTRVLLELVMILRSTLCRYIVEPFLSELGPP